MIEYKKIKVSGKDKYIDELLKLSKAWADENSCPAYYPNEPSDFIDREIYIATESNQVVAYAIGDIKVLGEIGTALVQSAMEALHSSGINKVALVVFSKNEDGNTFWEKTGFTKVFLPPQRGNML